MYEYRATLVSIYDADTMRFDVDLGFFTWLKNQSVRLYGVNAWEIKGPEREKGLVAKGAVQGLFTTAGPEVIIRTYKDAKEKYGRWLGRVELSDGTILNEWVVANGHAVVNFYD